MMRYLRAVGRSALDELRTIVGFRPLLVILLALPLVYPITVALLYSANSATERPAVIIDNDNSALSRTFTLWIDATNDVKIVDRLSSVKDGWTRVQRHEAEMLIFIPPDFSTRIKKGGRAVYKVWVNSANIYTLGTSLPGLYNVTGTMNAGLAAKYMMRKGVSSATVKARAVPIAVDMRNLFLPFAGYGEFFAPGIMMTVIQQMMLICLGFSIGYQKKMSMLKMDEPFLFSRLTMKLLVQSPFYIAASALVVYIIMPVFGWRVTNLDMCMVLFFAMLMTLAPFAILLSSMMKDHFAALEFLMFLSAPLFLMSGFTWPFDRMPAYIQAVASVFPITPALQALRSVLSKSSQWADLAPYFVWMAKLFCAYTTAALIWLTIISRKKRIIGLFKNSSLFKNSKPIKDTKPLDGLAANEV